MKKYLFLIASSLLFSTLLMGQGNYNMGTTRNITNGCGAFIYDNGGASANYEANRKDTITIYSNDPSNPAIQIKILELGLHESDTIFVYDSDQADPARLVDFGGNKFFLNSSSQITVGQWSYAATINNPSGAITVRFKSDETNHGSGFKIETECQPICQRISAYIDPTACIPPLVYEDSILSANLCENQSLTIAGYAEYPDNNLGGYTQSHDSTYFSWNVGDTTYAGWSLTTINHVFEPGQSREVKLILQDQRGCINQNDAKISVRTSKNPIQTINSLPDACLGIPVDLNIGYSIGSDVLVEPVIIQNNSLGFDSAVYIPDGLNCAVECYRTDVTFTGFDPSQSITSINDIISICFTMEHSFLGDLSFKIFCPNGQSTTMHGYKNNGSNTNNPIDLGIPVSGSSPTCQGDSALAGVGWNYCWSENTTLGYQYHGNLPHYIYLDQATSSCDSTNRQNNTNYYRPYNSFSNLIGCPLNGVWQIEICDTWGGDDGWIFGLQLSLDPNLVPQSWSYSILIDEVLWSDPLVASTSDTTAIIQTPLAGIFDYAFTIVDEYGCTYDSIISLTVIQGPDASVVQNGDILSALTYGPEISYQWLDCDDNYEAIVGETDQSFFATSDGNYALKVTEGECYTISSCYEITIVGIWENTYETQINIYPNPTNGKINIDLGHVYSETQVKIYDIKGKLMDQFLFENKNVLEFHINDITGIYILDVQSGNRKALLKVIKK
ncbi:MAG: T9SS type A sorting domain-containing protein [Bacteroidales bacterium]|nr:T9SS type A sorting domain-containing protein [Bacteroidales bacterium]